MQNLKNIIKEIAKKNKDGFTFNIEKMELVKYGVVGAYLETQFSFEDKGLEKAISHAKQNDKIVGGWLENNKFFYDSCKVFKNSELKEAIKFGIENKQIAIFDLTNLEPIRLE